MSLDQVLYEDLEADVTGGRRCCDGKWFTGIAIHRDAQTRRILAMTTYFDGQPHGPDRAWYADGTLKLEGFNEMGNRHGTYREWYADGRPKTEAFFELSVCVQEKAWSPTGELLRSFILQPNDPDYRRLAKKRSESGPIPIITTNDDLDVAST